ncbi:hypothetical protein ACH5RR_014671 [Cinchona calisaya]|uniref:Uncharacterized protein n=1 Tax=Cinchona calisaya TaxID=153742 RepID=A0ABD2ZUJ2_9GENT
MAAEQSQEEYADWRARQKERERERRRMRDRQRRQSMSLEEREKHLARRRKNYQLRRQRAANVQLGTFQQTDVNISSNVMSSTIAGDESEIQNDDLALVCVSEPAGRHQSNCVMQDGFGEAYEKQDSLITKYDGETTFHDETYKYPRIPSLNQIKQLARRLNSSADKSSAYSGGNGAHVVINEEMVNPLCVGGRRIRLIHIKHLARTLHSNRVKTSEQNQLCKTQGQYNVIQREIPDQMPNDGAFWNGQSNDAA